MCGARDMNTNGVISTYVQEEGTKKRILYSPDERTSWEEEEEEKKSHGVESKYEDNELKYE